MLVIRDAQLEALAAKRVRELCAWLKPHLRKHFGDRLRRTDDVELNALIESGVARARKHGARRTQSVCKFVYLRVLFDERLEALPWAAETLARTDIADPDLRIEILYLRARAVLASQAGAH